MNPGSRLIVAVALAHAGCAQREPPAPPSGPTPLAPTAGALIIVVDPAAGSLVTLLANPASGSLDRVASLPLSDPGLGAGTPLAADPHGRFVYLGGRYLRSFVLDRGSGNLAEAAREGPGSQVGDIAVSDHVIHVVFQVSRGGFGTRGSWNAFEVDPAGVIGERLCSGCPRGLPSRYDPSMVVLSADWRFAYTDSVDGLYISAIQPDDSLIDLGEVPIVGEAPFRAAFGPGFLAITAWDGALQTLSVDGATGLPSPVQHVADTGLRAPRVVVSRTGLIAVAGVTTVPGAAVQTWSVDAGSARLVSRAGVAGQARRRNLAFHPSGRFLYVSTEGDGVRGYAVDEAGGLTEVAHTPVGGGALVSVAHASSVP